MAAEKNHRARLERLRSMSRGELVDRVRQRLTMHLDAHRSRRRYDFGAEFLPSTPAMGRFFFNASELQNISELLKQRFPASAANIMTSAERISHHRFDLLGYEDLNYGDEIDWHLDLVHGKRGPRKPWFQIRYLDFEEVGDAKITWELNRHQHLVTLAKAYWLSGEEKFASELVAQWKAWQASNPYPIGMNWASSLEVAFRCLSWIWVYFLLDGSPFMTPELRREWVRAIGISGRHIETYLSTYFSPNTHLLGEAVALFFAGTLFPGLANANRWKQRGWRVITESAKKQVRADGFYFEQSTYYHVYALDLFLHARILAARNDVAIPEEFDAVLLKMLNALCLLGRAGAVPRIGDDDGGRVFDPRRNRAEHLLDPLSTGAVLFLRGEFKFVVGSPREETLWLLGEAGLASFDKLPNADPSSESVALKDSGLHLMADADIGQQLLMDAGPQGPGTAGHGHADALSITLASNGRLLLMDPGTLEYIGDDQQDRANFRGTSAHNTMRVDGLDQAESSGPFAWATLPEVNVEHWIAGRKFDLFAGGHTGYQRLVDPVVHQRWVFHRKSGFWFVRDIANGRGSHSVELSWHLGSGLLPASARDYLFGDGHETLALMTAEGHGWSQSAQRESWSPAYGRRERTTVITFGKAANLPLEFVTLLLSNPGLQGEKGLLERLGSDSGASGYRYSRAGEEHYFFFANSKNVWTLGAWTSDAQFLYWSSNHKQDEQVLALCAGTYVEVRGMRILAATGFVEYAEVVGAGGKSELFSSDVERVQWQGSLQRLEADLSIAERDPSRIGV